MTIIIVLPLHCPLDLNHFYLKLNLQNHLDFNDGE